MRHKIQPSDFNFEFTGNLFKEKDVIENNYYQLSGTGLLEKISDKIIFGDYLMGYKYITELYKDGTSEGINNVGSHNSGIWFIDMKNNILDTKWDNGWIDTITRAYEVDGNIELFDIDTGNWRTTFKAIKSLEK